MNNREKSPQRMCVACRKMFDKRALLRIVRTPDGEVCIDESGKKSGRGAYVCTEEACRNKCAKGLLKKHLSCEIPLEIYEQLKEVSLGKR